MRMRTHRPYEFSEHLHFGYLTLRLPEDFSFSSRSQAYAVRRTRKTGETMDVQNLQIAAGSVSSPLFIAANGTMLLKAFKTRNLRSYSLSNIVLGNIGNVIHWVYISGLPAGPIWMLHNQWC
jgi:hypothetical protein